MDPIYPWDTEAERTNSTGARKDGHINPASWNTPEKAIEEIQVLGPYGCRQIVGKAWDWIPEAGRMGIISLYDSVESPWGNRAETFRIGAEDELEGKVEKMLTAWHYGVRLGLSRGEKGVNQIRLLEVERAYKNIARGGLGWMEILDRGLQGVRREEEARAERAKTRGAQWQTMWRDWTYWLDEKQLDMPLEWWEKAFRDDRTREKVIAHPNAPLAMVFTGVGKEQAGICWNSKDWWLSFLNGEKMSDASGSTNLLDTEAFVRLVESSHVNEALIEALRDPVCQYGTCEKWEYGAVDWDDIKKEIGSNQWMALGVANRREKLPDDIVTLLVSHPQQSVRMAMARRADLPTQAALRLARDPDSAVHDELIWFGRLNDAIIWALCADISNARSLAIKMGPWWKSSAHVILHGLLEYEKDVTAAQVQRVLYWGEITPDLELLAQIAGSRSDQVRTWSRGEAAKVMGTELPARRRAIK